MRTRLVDPTRLRALRQGRGYTLTALADKAGVSLSFVKYVEAGTTQPSDLYATALAEALGCDVTDFSDPKKEAA